MSIITAGAGASVPVYLGQDHYVPAFQVFVAGRTVQAQDVMSVTYSDALERVDAFEMTLNNWDAAALAFKYSDGDLFLPWRDVSLYMGYHSRGGPGLTRMLSGQITTMTPNFPASGGPTLLIRGLSQLHKFRTKQLTRTYRNQKDTEIALDLIDEINKGIAAASRGPKLALDPADRKYNLQKERPNKFVIIQNQFPIVFLLERARRIGYDLTLSEPAFEGDDVTVNFRETSRVPRPTYVLQWGVSLIDFQPALRTADQVAKVTVRGWQPLSKAPIEATATRADLAGEKVINPKTLGITEPDLAQEITVDEPVADQAEAQELSRRILRQKAAGLITARGRTIGLPSLRSGVKVEIRGLGKRFSGIYLVTETSHTIGESGYTTGFSARMEETIPEASK